MQRYVIRGSVIDPHPTTNRLPLPMVPDDSEPATQSDSGCDHPLVKEFDHYNYTLTVPEAFEHPDGFTTYKILIQATPKNALEQDSARYVLWTRYRCLHQLYTNLKLAKEKLQLRGQFPDFPKPKIFGKHNPDIISIRRAAAEAFLEFAMQHKILCRVVPFVQFLKEFELEPDDALYCSDLIPVLQPESAQVSSLLADQLLNLTEPPTVSAGRDSSDPERAVDGIGQSANPPESPIVEHSNTTTIRVSDNVARYNSICHGPMTSSSRDIPSLVTEDLSMIGSVGRSGGGMPVGSHEETDGWLNQSMDKLKIMAHNSQRHHGSPSSSRSSIAESNDSLTDRSDSFFTINDCSLSTNDLQHVGGPTVNDTSKSVQSSPLHKLLVKAKMSHTIGNANSAIHPSLHDCQPACPRRCDPPNQSLTDPTALTYPN